MSSLSLIRAVQLEALVPKPALVILKMSSSKFATVVAAEFVVDL